MTLDEYKARAKQDLDNAFEKGKAQGGTDWLYYASRLNNTFGGVVFPENTEFIGRFKGATDYGYMFNNCRNIKSVKMITETPDTILNMTAFCAISSASTPTLELVDFSEFNKQFNNTYNMFSYQRKLKKIVGAMDLTSCTNAQFMFRYNDSLEEVEFVNGTIGVNLDFSACKNLKAESYDSIIKGHSKEASVTLTLPKETTVRSVYDAKYGSGAWDAITAEYPNVTIAYM